MRRARRQRLNSGARASTSTCRRAIAAAPQHAYTLVTSTPSSERTSSGTRFYLGGNIYTDGASVPNRYKVEDPQYPDPRRSTASVFTLT